MIFQIKSTGIQTEIDIKGRLTYSDYGLFRQITDVLGETDRQVCTINLSELEFIDSAGLGMLLLSRDKMQECNGKVILK